MCLSRVKSYKGLRVLSVKRVVDENTFENKLQSVKLDHFNESYIKESLFLLGHSSTKTMVNDIKAAEMFQRYSDRQYWQ